MPLQRQYRIGVMYDRDQPPERLASYCRALEELGADDVWLVEDLGWAGSIASAATALTVTSSIRVGIGIAPLPLRNPALLAMELATLARLHPGRLAAGVGHGISDWMESVGALPRSPLALLEESLLVIRELLGGEIVSRQGRAVTITGTRLVHPPTTVPPVLAGVVRPRSLEASGRAADGTILIEGRGPADIAAARVHIDAGRRAAGRSGPHEVVALAYACVSDSQAEIQRLAQPVRDSQSDLLGVATKDVFVAAGTPAEVTAQIDALAEAGADCVVLHFLGSDHLRQAQQVLAARRRN